MCFYVVGGLLVNVMKKRTSLEGVLFNRVIRKDFSEEVTLELKEI